MRLTTKGRFAVTAMIDLALRQDNGPVTLAAISQRQHIRGHVFRDLLNRAQQFPCITPHQPDLLAQRGRLTDQRQ